MYLVKINPKTGLVDISDTRDGVMAIKDFKAVIEKYGLACFTCIALTVDHFSPINFFKYKERHLKAMKMVVGSRDAFNFNEDLIQQALITYRELQHNPTLKELEMLKEMRMDMIAEIDGEKDPDLKLKLFSKLNNIKDKQKSFESQADMKQIIQNAPVVNGYELSRIEELLLNKKSSYYESQNKEQAGVS